MTDNEMITQLLSEYRYVLETGDIRDSIRNNADLREKAADRLGFPNYAAFGKWCDTGEWPARQPSGAPDPTDQGDGEKELECLRGSTNISRKPRMTWNGLR